MLVSFETLVHYVSLAPFIAAGVTSGRVRPTLSVGPRFDVRVAERSTFDEQDTASTESYDAFSYGTAVAVGVRIPLSGAVRSVRADVRYSRMNPLADLSQNNVEARIGVGF